jgi:polar amino acid transport system substrate-binding protein
MKNTSLNNKLFLSVLISLSLFSFSCFAQQTNLKISTWCGPPFSKPDNSGYLDQILKEAFSRMNLTVDIHRKPAERSLHDANRGLVDGEFIRVEKIAELYPNLLTVPEHIYEMEFIAFTKSDKLKIDNGWKSLQTYKVGIVRGWKILEENIIYSNGPRSDISKQELLFTMLDKGRIDVAVYSRYFGLEVIKQLGIKGIKTTTPPLAVKKMHLFLHKKHKDKIPAINEILKSMKKDGTFTKIREKILL